MSARSLQKQIELFLDKWIFVAQESNSAYVVQDIHKLQRLATSNTEVNMFTQQKYGKTLVGLAVEHQKINVLKALVETLDVNIGQENGILLTACFVNPTRSVPWITTSPELCFNIIQYLVENGADVNDTVENGWSPVVACCSNGDLNAVKYLVSKGADLKKVGSMALWRAVISTNAKLIKYLLVESNADISVDDCYDSFIAACENNRTDIVKIMIDYGFNVNGNDDYTPLMVSIREECLDVAKLLIKHKANVHIKSDGKTVLHMACEDDKSTEVVALLLKNDANVNEQTEEDEMTPLHYACENMNFDIIKLLIKHGAYLFINDIDGQRPLEYVPTSEIEIIDYLRKMEMHAFQRLSKGDSSHVVKNSTEFINSSFMSVNRALLNAETRKEYFYNARNVDPQSGKIHRAFHKNTMNKMRESYGQRSFNPFTKAHWPLHDEKAARTVLKRLPSKRQSNNAAS